MTTTTDAVRSYCAADEELQRLIRDVPFGERDWLGLLSMDEATDLNVLSQVQRDVVLAMRDSAAQLGLYPGDSRTGPSGVMM